jgi:hypothetical protein
MTPSSEKPDELDLDLPALDGDEEGVAGPESPQDVDVSEAHDAGDAFDDSTNEDAPIDHVTFDGAEGGWLLDSEAAGTALDVGSFDVSLAPEGNVLGDDESETAAGWGDLVSGEEGFVADGGEEGPLADDEELREEDLPALDADKDGDVSDDELYDRAILASDEDLRWDDRAWARVTDAELPTGPGLEEADDSGVLAVPGDDPTQSVRDATWKGFDESGHVMAATFVPGGSVVVALRAPNRASALIVRIQQDGEARIIAEVDRPKGVAPQTAAQQDDEEDAPLCAVTFVRWDAARGCLFVGGNFGVEAYRPAP